MKILYPLICAVFLTISCKEAIKNERKFIAEQSFEEIQFVEPKVNTSLVVNSKEDLLGYWVGNFNANLSDSELDSIYENESSSVNYLYRKITFSIDEIKGDSIIGHSISVGNISPFKGLLVENTSNFEMKVDEYKKEKTDGNFVIRINKSDSIMKGDWVAYYPEEVKITSRIFNLKKKIFVYNKEQKIEMTFFNTDKSKEFVYTTDTVDGKIEEYIDTEYFSTTEKVFEKNASIDELTSDFVSNLTKADIFILRNSIFARHGFAFRDKQLRMYFEQFDWYMPVFGDVKEDLTEVEIKNIDLLLRYEQNAEEYYDTFGR
ncbi:YARHG domain-containing protein [Flavobacterium cyclinae]|uniref:YARHG domain-containing protein n=1 Tax=Flavobacterium cyclinae TaxID=2895947 RepID=UPI001E4E65A6|nr:YARHG domain-containing protein [Flavobacterium cyclinae]UGS20367.1 YARHG domain-containing protein [Flavobacterium cyclinae]